jgi:thiosulfate dehydrogenase
MVKEIAMRSKSTIAQLMNVLLCAACISLVLIGCSEEVEFTTCDGRGKVKVAEEVEGQELVDAIMAQWKIDNPNRNWVAEEKERHELKPPADNSSLLKGEQGEGHTYGNYTERDLLMWQRETEKLVVEGSRIFHSAQLLKSQVSVSCDMCHPHAANTHPETYPKFQTQLGRVALLRDMIHWCIDNPVRGEHLAPDDPRMRALEAYIMAQRSGTVMQYGKH